MNKRLAVEELLAIADQTDVNGSPDPEGAHAEADRILLELVPAEVREAYEAVIDACHWWAYA